ncbi:MAG: hypothetical protein NT075_32675 [Chloroflexi bacterium]|nr:hypothetical protein [Chloroflexota bacterium]
MSVFMLMVIAIGFYSITRNVEQAKKSVMTPVALPAKPVVVKQKVRHA